MTLYEQNDILRFSNDSAQSLKKQGFRPDKHSSGMWAFYGKGGDSIALTAQLHHRNDSFLRPDGDPWLDRPPRLRTGPPYQFVVYRVFRFHGGRMSGLERLHESRDENECVTMACALVRGKELAFPRNNMFGRGMGMTTQMLQAAVIQTLHAQDEKIKIVGKDMMHAERLTSEVCKFFQLIQFPHKRTENFKIETASRNIVVFHSHRRDLTPGEDTFVDHCIDLTDPRGNTLYNFEQTGWPDNRPYTSYQWDKL